MLRTVLLVYVVIETVAASWSSCGGTVANGTTSSTLPSCVMFQFGGLYVDFDHPLQCAGTVRSWGYCSNYTGSARAYLTVWRKSDVLANHLDRVYIQELNNTTIPRCPGALVPNTPVEVKEGDYIGLLIPLDSLVSSDGPLPQLVCECVGGRIGFVQAVSETDEAAYLAAVALNGSLFMSLDACLVGISAVIEPRPIVSASTAPFGQIAPSMPATTSAVGSSSLPRSDSAGGGRSAELLSIAAGCVAVALLLVLAVLGLVVLLCAVVVRRRKMVEARELGKSISIGNAIYNISGCDTGRRNGGPIYEVPSTACTTTTIGSEATYLGSEYEAPQETPRGVASAVDQTDHTYKGHYKCAMDCGVPQLHVDATYSLAGLDATYSLAGLEATYAVAGPSTIPGTDPVVKKKDHRVPTRSESFAHQYHLLEQVVAGEYLYDDVRPFQQPPGHENELYAELAKFNVRRIPREEISIVGPLGSGHFGLVHRGLWRGAPPGGPPTQDVAIKSLPSGSDPLSRVKFLQEAAIMGQFRHPNVVHLFGSVIEGDSVLLVLEYLHNGDLFQYLQMMRKRSEFQFPSNMAATLLEICQQVAFGMHYLCSKGFIHRDLAARNILVSEDCVCKIADFGLSRDLADENYYVSKGGAIPVKWTAPEAVLYKKYSAASDVWSYGCLLYEVWSVGRKPFEGCDNVQVIQRVSAGYRLPPPPGCPRPVYKLMMSCWHPDSALRPMFRDILAILIGHNGTVLSILDDVATANTQAAVLGAPLEASRMLYSDLQSIYNLYKPS